MTLPARGIPQSTCHPWGCLAASTETLLVESLVCMVQLTQAPKEFIIQIWGRLKNHQEGQDIGRSKGSCAARTMVQIFPRTLTRRTLLPWPFIPDTRSVLLRTHVLWPRWGKPLTFLPPGTSEATCPCPTIQVSTERRCLGLSQIQSSNPSVAPFSCQNC